MKLFKLLSTLVLALAINAQTTPPPYSGMYIVGPGSTPPFWIGFLPPVNQSQTPLYLCSYAGKVWAGCPAPNTAGTSTSGSILPAPTTLVPGYTYYLAARDNKYIVQAINPGDIGGPIDLGQGGQGGVTGLLDSKHINWTVPIPASVLPPPATGGTNVQTSTGGFETTRTDATHVMLGGSCTSTTPCNVSYNNLTLRVSTQASITMTGTTTGLLYPWVDNTGAYFVGVPNGTAIVCQNCTAVQANSFPDGATPLSTIQYINGQFVDKGIADFRSVYNKFSLTAGAGLIVTNSGSKTIASVDSSQVALYSPVPSSTSSICQPGNLSYDSQYVYICVAQNRWLRSSLSTF
jgi:hypothetical protein